MAPSATPNVTATLVAATTPAAARDTPIPTASPTATPTPTPTRAPLPPRTPPPPLGLANLDAIIAAILSHDAARIAPWVRGYDTLCDGNQFLPCPVGAPVGTTVRAFDSSGCDGNSWALGAPAGNGPAVRDGQRWAEGIAEQADRLIGAVRNQPPTRYADYELYFATPTNGALAVGVRGDSITSMRAGCAGDATDLANNLTRHPERLLGPLPFR